MLPLITLLSVATSIINFFGVYRHEAVEKSIFVVWSLQYNNYIMNLIGKKFSLETFYSSGLLSLLRSPLSARCSMWNPIDSVFYSYVFLNSESEIRHSTLELLWLLWWSRFNCTRKSKHHCHCSIEISIIFFSSVLSSGDVEELPWCLQSPQSPRANKYIVQKISINE